MMASAMRYSRPSLPLSEEALLDLSSRLEVMMRQESTSYQCPDYLHGLEVKRRTNRRSSRSSRSSSSSSSTSSSDGIDEKCREKICEWCFQVVDHFEFHRETVSVAMNYLDRYLAKVGSSNGHNIHNAGSVNKKTFQLAAMTALSLAIKLYEPSGLNDADGGGRPFPISSLVELSRGYFTVQDIVEMEMHMMHELEWLVHPPTSLTFVQEFMRLIPTSGAANLTNFASAAPSAPSAPSPETIHDINELSRFLTELSICDYFFTTKRSSSVAIASLAIALEAVEQRLEAKSKARVAKVAELANRIQLTNGTNCTNGTKSFMRQVSSDCVSDPDGAIGMDEYSQMIVYQPHLKKYFLEQIQPLGVINFSSPSDANGVNNTDEVLACYDRLREMYVAGGFEPLLFSGEGLDAIDSSDAIEAGDEDMREDQENEEDDDELADLAGENAMDHGDCTPVSIATVSPVSVLEDI